MNMIEKIIEAINEKLHEYENNFSSVANTFFHEYGLKLNYFNERSIAYYITNELYKIAENLFPTEYNVLNEGYLVPMIGVIEANGNRTQDSEETVVDEPKKRTFVPDAIIHSNAIIPNTIFIEYKVDNIFKFYKLSNDFLKFLTYSAANREKTAFVYILFVKKPQLSILNSMSDSRIAYQIIDEDLRINNINPNASVFIFANMRGNITQSNSIEAKHSVLYDINKVIEEIERKELQPFQIEGAKNFDENPYYRSMNFFGKNVIIASVLRKEYPFLSNLYNLLKTHTLEISLQDEFISLESFRRDFVPNTERFISDTVTYYNHHIDYYLKSGKKSISSETYNVSYRRASWVLIIVVVFCKLNNISHPSIDEHISRLHKEYEATIASQIEVYRLTGYLHQLNRLALGMLYYIIRLYELLYSMNESGLVRESEDFQSFIQKKRLLFHISQLRKLISHRQRDKPLEWDFSIDDFGVEVLNDTMNNFVSDENLTNDLF